MENRNLILALLGLGAVLALVRGERTGPATLPDQAAPDRGADSAWANAVADWRAGERVLRDYLGGWPDTLTPPHRPRLEFLLVTLPDPVASNSDWSYDTGLEAVSQALEAAGYLPDRFILTPARGFVRLPVTRGGLLDSVPAREALPSVFLFKRQDEAVTVLKLVYVVGELPTSGLYHLAFRTALQERADLLRRDCLFDPAPDHDTLRIVGPTFSGTARSLAAALRRARGPLLAAQAVEIVSGSATDHSIGEVFREEVASVPLRFHSTVHPDVVLDGVRDAFFEAMRIPRERVAILKESSTAYGRSLSSAVLASDQGSVATAPSLRETGQALEITFPLSIGSLRSEYELHPDARVAEPLVLGQAPSSRVPLELRADTGRRERPRPQSRLTAPAVELVLSQIVRQLEERSIRYVGLQATDVRDKLFLAEQIRRRVPDIRFFTHEGNVLFLRPDRLRALHGMFVFSTYPLVLDNQGWTGRTTQRRPFANEPAEGTFNATLAQLKRPDLMEDYRSPGGQGDIPPVWVTAVGSASIVPIKVVRPDSTGPLVVGDVAPRPAPATSRVSLATEGALVALALALGLLGLWTVWRARRRMRQADGFVQSLKPPAPDGTELAAMRYHHLRHRVESVSLYIHRELYLGLILVAGLGMVLPAAVLVLNERGHVSPGGAAALLAGLAAVLAGIAATAWNGFRLIGRSGRPDIHLFFRSIALRHWSWPIEVVARYTILFAGLAYLVVLALYATRIAGLPIPDRWIFFHRAARLDGELSPLLPLALSALGFAVWAVWHYRRIGCLLHTTPVEQLSLSAEGTRPRKAPWARAVRRVRHRLYNVVPTTRGLLLALVLAIMGVQVAIALEPTIERGVLPSTGWLGGFRCRSFDLLLGYGIVATLIAVPWAAFRLYTVWTALRRFLGEVAALPILGAFLRLPKTISGLTRLTVFSAHARGMLDAAADERWRKLAPLHPTSAVGAGGPVPPEREELAGRIDECMSAGREKTAPADRLSLIREALLVAWNPRALPEQHEVVVQREGEDEREQRQTRHEARVAFDRAVGPWIECAEEYAALAVVDYVETVMRQIRMLAVFLLIALLTSTAFLSSYPYYPQEWVKLLFLLVLAASIAVILAVTIQMNQDAALSSITNGDVGKVNWDTTFVRNLLLFVVLPVLSFLTSEFPLLRDFFTSWLDPVSRAFGVR